MIEALMIWLEILFTCTCEPDDLQRRLVWSEEDILCVSLMKKLTVTIIHQSLKASRLRRLPAYCGFYLTSN
ncbi:hypothetical protein HRI_004488800 [Hibiscus trionum]|uniref:Uncharacterized protein n=1 Tax=Hibiscus trionum TaxID=183268 RepID=A0A9W7J442_HIBTR|nr:hypothetical protein HRI_004488800 [Hibiscus trionum]